MSTVTPERLTDCKRYLQAEAADDDATITLLLQSVDEYLEGAGLVRTVAPSQYDLIAFAMTLDLYDGRVTSPADVARGVLVRRMLNQLKLRCAYGEG